MGHTFLYERSPEAITEVLPPNDFSSSRPVLVATKFDTQRALEYLQKEGRGELDLDEQLKEFQFSRLEFPREEDGCPGAYTKAEGLYKGQPFKIFVNFLEVESVSEFEGPEEFKEEIIKFFNAGDYATALLWT